MHNALPYTEPPREHKRHEGPVLWLARFSPDKGPDLAINACREAGLPLVLAGKSSEDVEAKYLEEEIRPMLRDNDDVRLVLDADRTTTQQWVQEASCLIMPIRWDEPFGMVMIEAMACGTPVIALNAGSVPEVIVDGVTGIICERPDQIAGAISAVDQISPAACRRHVAMRFNSATLARGYAAAYRAAIDAMPQRIVSERHRTVQIPSLAP